MSVTTDSPTKHPKSGPASVIPSWVAEPSRRPVPPVETTPTVLADLAEVRTRRFDSVQTTALFRALLATALGLALAAVAFPMVQTTGTGVDDAPPAFFLQPAD